MGRKSGNEMKNDKFNLYFLDKKETRTSGSPQRTKSSTGMIQYDLFFEIQIDNYV